MKAAAAANVADRLLARATAAPTSTARRLYPVSIAAPNVIGVAATEPGRRPRAAGLLQLRPADRARSRRPASTSSRRRATGGYESKSGTSMAAPHVDRRRRADGRRRAAAAGRRPARAAARARRPRRRAGRRRDTSTRSARCSPPARATSFELSQPPQARVLLATRRGRVMRASRSRCAARPRPCAGSSCGSTAAVVTVARRPPRADDRVARARRTPRLGRRARRRRSHARDRGAPASRRAAGA